jgi:hypothetical protein
MVHFDSDTLIVSFAGNAKKFGGIERFEFVQFLEKYFGQINKHFYIDTCTNSYHNGILGISNNIDETVCYLKNEIEKYKNIIFLGTSAGGYAAILFGSLLNITSVIAFIPQTIRRNPTNIDEKYRDISKYINDSTKYYLYGDLSVSNTNDPHHISHCERISHFPNVIITKKKYVNVKEMRNTGELYQILHNIIFQADI